MLVSSVVWPGSPANHERDVSMKTVSRTRSKPYVWFIAPAIIYVLVFTLYPAIYGVALSFTNMHFGYVDYQFVGLENYIRLFQWRHIGTILRNTGIFVGTVVFLQMSLGLLIALSLNTRVTGRGIARTVAVLPWALPTVVVGLMFKQMFIGSKLGIMNVLLSRFGLEPVAWLTNPTMAMLILILSLTWKGTALSIILQLGGLQTIPTELYEAAVIDGANARDRFFKITLPLLRPSLLINLIMASAGTFNHVDIPLSLTGGGPRRATEVLALALYKQGFETLDASFAATIATLILVINIVLTIVYLKLLKPGTTGLSDQ
jgi:ABC-type sugar transport system permease subunit